MTEIFRRLDYFKTLVPKTKLQSFAREIGRVDQNSEIYATGTVQSEILNFCEQMLKELREEPGIPGLNHLNCLFYQISLFLLHRKIWHFQLQCNCYINRSEATLKISIGHAYTALNLNPLRLLTLNVLLFPGNIFLLQKI